MGTSREALRRNIDAFNAIESQLIETHLGEYALLRDGELIGTYEEKEDARVDAARLYPDGNYAISPAIGSPPANLGAMGLLVSPVAV